MKLPSVSVLRDIYVCILLSSHVDVDCLNCSLITTVIMSSFVKEAILQIVLCCLCICSMHTHNSWTKSFGKPKIGM